MGDKHFSHYLTQNPLSAKRFTKPSTISLIQKRVSLDLFHVSNCDDSCDLAANIENGAIISNRALLYTRSEYKLYSTALLMIL